MRTPTKFVNPLRKKQKQRLLEIQKSDPAHRTRMRAHAILLSARGYSLDQIADIYQQDRERVSLWLDWWDEFDVGISFSITAAVRHFEKLFATRLRRTDAEGITCTAGTSLPLDKLSPTLARHVETIVFPTPPEFGPTDFH